MNAGLFALMVLAGGLGAATRFVVDGAIRSRVKSLFSWPTAIINMTGAFLLGLVTGLVAGDWASSDVSAVVGTGFLGGYTTFSTASYETVQLLRERHYGGAALYGLGVLVVCGGLAFLGYRWGLDG